MDPIDSIVGPDADTVGHLLLLRLAIVDLVAARFLLDLGRQQ